MDHESKNQNAAELTSEEINHLLETIAEVEREEVVEQLGPPDEESKAA